MSKSVGLINATIRHGQALNGVQKAPQFLKNSGLYGRLYYTFDSVRNYFIRDNNAFSYSDLYKVTKTSLEKNDFSLILGGDHSLSFSTIPATKEKYPDLKIIWIDAHGDMNTPESSPSGHLHGMPLAALSGLFDVKSLNKNFYWLDQCIRPEDIYILGVRDLDPKEKLFLQEHPFNIYDFNHIKEKGLDKVLDEIKKDIGLEPVHISFDVDAINPKIAPATGVPVSDGFSFQEAQIIAKTLGELNAVTLEAVEFNPDVDQSLASAEATAQVIISFIRHFLNERFSPAAEKINKKKELPLVAPVI